jgi:hypothetical protein
MDPSYITEYRTRSISQRSLSNKLISIYQARNVDVNRLMNYDELLFVLDEACVENRADRDITKELHEQAMDYEGRVSMKTFVNKYI